MPPTHPSQADVAAAYRTLIAHETEPKEQDFYRTRLQRLEQATESVCEFDCRSRVAAAGVGVYCPQCSAKSADTDLTAQLAKAIRAAWVDRLDWDELAHAALKFLTVAGRLVPAGGMALTAELVEDVRIVLGLKGSQDIKVVLDAQVRLRAMFPATEPAEVNGNICTEGNSSPTVVHVHHHDIEAHAASFNEGYEEAVRQFTDPTSAEPAEDVVTVTDGDVAAAWEDGFTAGCGHASADCQPRSTTFAAEEEAKEEAQQLRHLSTALRAALGILDPLEGGGWSHAWRTADDLDDCANRISPPAVTANNDSQADVLEPGLIADGDGNEYWFNGTYMTPRYIPHGFVPNSKSEQAHGPFSQVATLSPLVVPASTEAEWPTWQEVPGEIAVIRDREGDRWKRADAGSGWKYFSRKTNQWTDVGRPSRMYAPFVAAEEEGA